MKEAKQLKALIADIKTIIEQAEAILVKVEQRVNDIEKKTK